MKTMVAYNISNYHIFNKTKEIWKVQYCSLRLLCLSNASSDIIVFDTKPKKQVEEVVSTIALHIFI